MLTWVRLEWRAANISPSVNEVLEGLDAADPLPHLPSTGWEETTLLAVAMADDPVAYLTQIMDCNLALRGRVAVQPELMTRLPDKILDDLRARLVERSRNPEADLRHRIACGYALGDLEDPRFERRAGPFGEYILPPLVRISGGSYPFGGDAPYLWSEEDDSGAHIAQYPVDLAQFSIGAFALSNAEYQCFLDCGGYEDERWWDTPVSQRWRRGVGTSRGQQYASRYWALVFRETPSLLDWYVEQNLLSEQEHVVWQTRYRMSEPELDVHLAEERPDTLIREPAFWADKLFSHPGQPVVGLSWYEARAYLVWLSAQSGLAFRLPTEMEWEAAARGKAGRSFAFGDEFDRLCCNVSETQIRRPTPVGVFPGGDTPEGVCDMSGNVAEWTASVAEKPVATTRSDNPSDAFDHPANGLEDEDIQRVVRGGSWRGIQDFAHAATRYRSHPAVRNSNFGVRVLCETVVEAAG